MTHAIALTEDARRWLLDLACSLPSAHGYPERRWTPRTLALHAQLAGPAAGHDCLAGIGTGTLNRLLKTLRAERADAIPALRVRLSTWVSRSA